MASEKIVKQKLQGTQLYFQFPVPTGDNTASFDWQDYDLLQFDRTFYSNTYQTCFMSKDQFSVTSSTRRVILQEGSNSVEAWQNGEGSVTVRNTGGNFGLKVTGYRIE